MSIYVSSVIDNNTLSIFAEMISHYSFLHSSGRRLSGFGDPFGTNTCPTRPCSQRSVVACLYPLTCWLPRFLYRTFVAPHTLNFVCCFIPHCFAVFSRITQTKELLPMRWRAWRWKTFVRTRLRLSPGCNSRGEECGYRYASILLDFIPLINTNC